MFRNRKASVLKVVLPVLAVALAVAGIAVAKRPAWTPPMNFNHEVHAKAKVDCLQCHLGVMDTSERRFPNLSVCTGCHKDAPGNNPGKQELAAIVAEKKPFDWDPPRRVPDHVFFPHDIHVDIAGFACDKCHVEKPGETITRESIPIVGMYVCMDCHAKSDRPAAKRAATDCAECHR